PYTPLFRSPLQPGLRHPSRRAAFGIDEEIDCGTDAKADALGSPALDQRMRQQFLLRRADGQQGKSRRPLFYGSKRGFKLGAILQKPHWRVVVKRILEPETIHQRSE